MALISESCCAQEEAGWPGSLGLKQGYVAGYDGGSSDSEYEEALMSDHEPRCPLMPDFWLIIKIQQDRVEVYYHTR